MNKHNLQIIKFVQFVYGTSSFSKQEISSHLQYKTVVQTVVCYICPMYWQ